MFKKFTAEENVSGKSQMKSSAQRQVRIKIEEQMPLLVPDYIDQIMPKKQKAILVKCSDYVSIICMQHEHGKGDDSGGDDGDGKDPAVTIGDMQPLFFQLRDGPYIPCLRLLHMYPMMLPQVQVDRGAIKHIMKGADIMCPGLTSAGADLGDKKIDENAIVAIMAEGKKHAVAIGKMKMSSDNIKSINKGIGVENVHFIGDGLWKITKLE